MNSIIINCDNFDQKILEQNIYNQEIVLINNINKNYNGVEILGNVYELVSKKQIKEILEKLAIEVQE